MEGYQNIKHFLQNVILKIVFLLKKLKILYHGHMLLVILTGKKLMERFTKKNCEGKSNRV